MRARCVRACCVRACSVHAATAPTTPCLLSVGDFLTQISTKLFSNCACRAVKLNQCCFHEDLALRVVISPLMRLNQSHRRFGNGTEQR